MQRMKVLVIVDNLQKGGVYQVVRNFYNILDDVSMDFATYATPIEDFEKEIVARGNKCFIIKRASKILPTQYIKQIKNIILDHGPYDAIHIHTGFFIWLSAIAGRKCHVNSIVGHGHGSQWAVSNPIVRTVERIGRLMNRKYCTKMFACSDASGKYNFGYGYTFLPNIIDIRPEIFECDNEYLLNEYKTEHNLVIGYLGMFSEVKNTHFLVDLAKYICDNKYNSIIVAAGTGPTFDAIKKECQDSNMGIIKLLGYRSDSYELLKTFDVLIVPSVSEGMSLSILESQIMGTPVVCSSGVPVTNDLKIGLYKQMKNYSVEEWYLSCIEMKEKKLKMTYELCVQALEKIHYDKNSVKRELIRAYQGK